MTSDLLCSSPPRQNWSFRGLTHRCHQDLHQHSLLGLRKTQVCIHRHTSTDKPINQNFLACKFRRTEKNNILVCTRVICCQKLVTPCKRGFFPSPVTHWTSCLPELGELSCRSADVNAGQSFRRAPPQSHRLSTR